MTFKVAADAGHAGFGVTPGKRSPANEYEWDFNNKVILAFEEALKQYEGVEFLRTDDRSGRTDVPLKTRTDRANNWGADIYISFHHNANTGRWGEWTGTETYTYLGYQPKSEKLGKLVHERMVKAYGLRDRGMKKENFHIVRESKMPAILLEGGYMDSTTDIKRLRDNLVLTAAGFAVAAGVAEYAGLKKKVKSATAKPMSEAKEAAELGLADAQLQAKPADDRIGVLKILQNTVVREEADVHSPIIKKIKAGGEYKVSAYKDGWYNIGGWVYAENVNFLPNKSAKIDL